MAGGQLARIALELGGRCGDHLACERAVVSHNRAGVTRHDPLAHEGEVALAPVGVTPEELNRHDETEDCIAQKLKAFVRLQARGRPLRMQQRLSPEVRLQHFQKPGEVTR